MMSPVLVDIFRLCRLIYSYSVLKVCVYTDLIYRVFRLTCYTELIYIVLKMICLHCAGLQGVASNLCVCQFTGCCKLTCLHCVDLHGVVVS